MKETVLQVCTMKDPLCAQGVEQILAAAQADEYIGFCDACGAEHYGVEPDARNYPCWECGKFKVYGAEDLLIGIV